MATRQTRNSLALTPAGRLDEAHLKQVLGYQLAQAAIVTDAIFRREVEDPLGLRPVEYTVLTLVADNAGSSQARIARALSVTPPHVTALVDRLEERRLVARQASANDRRAQVLTITPSGARLVRQATERILASERALLALSPGEQAILAELLHKVACARGASPG
ncbi:MarR family transcriptional regulator [Variovorax sp.]|uniref:MarR family winged helix-turn-helix transcriptional regulator n=1 Tax=Variovorax sp. TaxID=1871043 RepID=UPI002D25FDCF|nr:MarR family transcriptional regulator [Variovorax sp.]HYP83020.1 MarR family transcriptional regulator [Variovorax sp.]